MKAGVLSTCSFLHTSKRNWQMANLIWSPHTKSKIIGPWDLIWIPIRSLTHQGQKILQEPAGSPQTRRRHSALMEELLDKMEELKLGPKENKNATESEQNFHERCFWMFLDVFGCFWMFLDVFAPRQMMWFKTNKLGKNHRSSLFGYYVIGIARRKVLRSHEASTCLSTSLVIANGC